MKADERRGLYTLLPERGRRAALVIYIEYHQVVVKRRSLIVSLVYVLVVRPVCPEAAVCLSSLLPTRGTLQYVGDQKS